MKLEKDCIIIFNENEKIPLQIEDVNRKQYLCQPLTSDKVDLTMHISGYQQDQLKKSIDEIKNLSKVEGKDQPTLKIENVPHIIFGPKQLQTDQEQHEYRQKFYKEQHQQSNPKSNVAVLIYQGETYESLCQQISQYNKDDTQITPMVLINGKTTFKKLMRSNQKLFRSFYKLEYLPFNQKFITSNQHSLYFQIVDKVSKKTVYYFVFPKELNKLELIKWIYQGIISFIQPKFAAIAPSNVTYLQNINILQLFTILEKENKYFGVQSLNKIDFKGSFSDNFLGDFTDIALNLDCMFKLKQFHDPLSCIYKWERIEKFVEDYIDRLTKEYSKNTWAVGYNAILPKLMLKVANQELKFITKQISVQQFNENQFETAFNQFCELKQNVNYQLKECSCRNLFQWFISKVIFLQNYFAISICFFFSFQCPYQVVYNILEDSVGYTAISILLPFFYAINVLLFLLLTQLYHFQDKIIEKNQNKEIAIMGIKDEKQQRFDFQTSVISQNVDIMSYQQLANRNQINVELYEDEHFENVSYFMEPEDLTKKELYLLYQFPQLKSISNYIKLLIEIQNYLDFGIVLFILANLIIVHGKQILNEQSQQELIILASALVVILFHFITQGSAIFRLVFKFSLLSYFWHFLQLPKNISPALQRIAQKKQLASQLLLNFFLFYTLISIESYYNYSGYILIGILAYLSIGYLIMGFFKCISVLCYNTPIPKNSVEKMEVNQLDGQKFENENLITLIEKTRNRIVETVKSNNKHQDQLKLTQQLKNSFDLTNFAQTIKMKIQGDLQKQNLKNDDIQLINTCVEEAIKESLNNDNKQQYGQPKQNEENKQPNQNTIQHNQGQQQQIISNINSEFQMDDPKLSKQSSQLNCLLQSNNNIASQLNENDKFGSQLKQTNSSRQIFKKKKK